MSLMNSWSSMSPVGNFTTSPIRHLRCGQAENSTGCPAKPPGCGALARRKARDADLGGEGCPTAFRVKEDLFGPRCSNVELPTRGRALAFVLSPLPRQRERAGPQPLPSVAGLSFIGDIRCGITDKRERISFAHQPRPDI